ncbi:unnamed protein product [Pocillopora meandrina]|uniref:TNFR-Cys domain-containing protein n=1 Tax=Pocillopora meandrina TaxID=46732 RepID=A0AAU9XCJ8_9CNID|nr:unnamed protein product [Pocillopora meandrina]
MANGTQVALTCKNLRQLPLDKYVSKIECAPTTSLHVILDHYQSIFSSCFTRSGFVCHDCTSREKHSAPIYCANCSLCPVGTYSCTDGSLCLPCPAGNGILHVKSIWRYVTFKPIRCFRFLRQGVSRPKNRVVTKTGTSDELSHLIEESN